MSEAPLRHKMVLDVLAATFGVAEDRSTLACGETCWKDRPVLLRSQFMVKVSIQRWSHLK